MRLPVFLRYRSPRLYALLIATFFLLIVLNGSFLFTFPFTYRQAGSQEIKYQLRLLSEKYIKALSEERMDVRDEPRSGIPIYYDLNKTFAVLLESIMERLGRLEVLLGGTNDSRITDSIIHAKKLLSGAQEKCDLPQDTNRTHPQCEDKIKCMEAFWRTDPCYAHYEVDGTRCSLIIYLSEVEKFCPRLPWRHVATSTTFPQHKKAGHQFLLSGLFKLLNDNPTNFKWIKQRIQRLWPKWVVAYEHLAKKHNYSVNNRVKKRHHYEANRFRECDLKVSQEKALLFESGFKFGEKSLKGGPLGELVQWSDLIASLYVLGHQLVISSEIDTFISYAQVDPALKSSCPVHDADQLDIIFTDIVGLKQIKKKIPASLQNYKCRLRILDSFGTHAEFNLANYFMSNKDRLSGKKKNPWGGHSLNLQQFYNMYPHTPDNSFLGFAVETYLNTSEVRIGPEEKKVRALIYGKESYMWEGADTYINTIASLMELHATVAEPRAKLPKNVINHGVLSGPELHNLLRQVKLFVGLGFPYEGPTPLEAIANGAIFLNPKFDPPKGRQTLADGFFADKPTLRKLSSQNPYAEDFIDEPHVITVNISDLNEVKRAVLKAQNSEVDPFLPFEFTHEGMLERVNFLISRQDFCYDNENWPPFSAIRIILSEAGQSCKDACWKQNFICERSYFPKIKNPENLARFRSCQKVDIVADVDAPSQDYSAEKTICRVQKEPLLFSCASEAKHLHRVCPCRDFIKDQTAICAACL